MGVIFIGGVHAVGKTTACEFLQKEFDLECHSASALIKLEKASAIPENGKIVADIPSNQDLLIQAVKRISQQKNAPIVLDGHFTLPNVNDEIEEIEIDVFKALDIKCIIIFHDTPEAIASRFRARDGEGRSVALIRQHQEGEIAHAQSVAREFKISIHLLKSFDVQGLENEVRQCMANL